MFIQIEERGIDNAALLGQEPSVGELRIGLKHPPEVGVPEIVITAPLINPRELVGEQE